MVNASPVLRLQDAPLPHDENLTTLADDLIDIYNRKATKGFGNFHEDTTAYPFSSLLKNFIQNQGPNPFIDLTQATMRLIKSKIKTENLATGGYILFLFYEMEEKFYLFIALLRQAKGSVITENLTIDSTQHLQLDKLHIGCQFDISSWNSEQDNKQYITFIKGRTSQTTPMYFLEAIGCAEFTDSCEQTKEIIRAINDFADARNLSPGDKQQMRQKAHDYCVEEKNVSMDNLAAVIFGEDPDAFMQHVNSGIYKVSNGFAPDRRVLKRLREVSAQGEGIKLSFPASMVGTRVVLENRDGSRVLSIKNPPQKLIDAYEDVSS